MVVVVVVMCGGGEGGGGGSGSAVVLVVEVLLLLVAVVVVVGRGAKTTCDMLPTERLGWGVGRGSGGSNYLAFVACNLTRHSAYTCFSLTINIIIPSRGACNIPCITPDM